MLRSSVTEWYSHLFVIITSCCGWKIAPSEMAIGQRSRRSALKVLSLVYVFYPLITDRPVVHRNAIIEYNSKRAAPCRRFHTDLNGSQISDHYRINSYLIYANAEWWLHLLICESLRGITSGTLWWFLPRTVAQKASPFEMLHATLCEWTWFRHLRGSETFQF